MLRGTLREAALERAEFFPQVQLTRMAASDLEMIAVGAFSPLDGFMTKDDYDSVTRMAASDLEMIAVGAFSPLDGFMTKDDYDSVIDTMKLSNGLPWTIPVTLPVDDDTAAGLKEDQEIALLDGDHLMGMMTIAEKFKADKEREAREVYRTTDEAHPGVARLHRQGTWLLGGEVFMFNGPKNVEFPELRHEPAQSRRMFAARGWRRTVAFQTRNPIHRAHEYIQKTALEIVDGRRLPDAQPHPPRPRIHPKDSA
jgi:sulfate adenylyltransferase